MRKKNVLDMGLSGAASVLADSSEMRAAGKGYEPMPTFFSKQIFNAGREIEVLGRQAAGVVRHQS